MSEQEYCETKNRIEDICNLAAGRVNCIICEIPVRIGDLIYQYLQESFCDLNIVSLEFAKLAEDSYKEKLDAVDLLSNIMDYVRGRIDNTDTNLRVDSDRTIYRIEK